MLYCPRALSYAMCGTACAYAIRIAARAYMKVVGANRERAFLCYARIRQSAELSADNVVAGFLETWTNWSSAVRETANEVGVDPLEVSTGHGVARS
eukprot:3266964-Rhodomonas_salina.5